MLNDGNVKVDFIRSLKLARRSVDMDLAEHIFQDLEPKPIKVAVLDSGFHQQLSNQFLHPVNIKELIQHSLRE